MNTFALTSIGLLFAAALWTTRPTRWSLVTSRWSSRAGLAGVALVEAVAVRGLWRGTPLQLSVGSTDLLRFDLAATMLTGLIVLLGVVVLTYADRNLDGTPGAATFARWSNVALVGSLITVGATRFSVIAVGWILTTIATIALVGIAGGASGRRATSLAARALLVGDVGLLVAVVVLWRQGADSFATVTTAASLHHHAIGPVPLEVLVIVGALMAAMARAGQRPFAPWVPATVAAPTPVSALLHAGVVNAGGLLLLRLTPLLHPSSATTWIAVVVVGASVVEAVRTCRRRGDVKGALAYSTVAQMGFMLVMVLLGLPVVALAHIIGHALFKAYRFLDAGNRVEHVARRDHFTARSSQWSREARFGVAGLALAPVIAVGGGIFAMGHQETSWFVMVLIVAAAVGRGAWRLAEGVTTRAHVQRVALTSSVLSSGYLAVTAVLDRHLSPALHAHSAPLAVVTLVVSAIIVAGDTSLANMSLQLPRRPWEPRHDRALTRSMGTRPNVAWGGK